MDTSIHQAVNCFDVTFGAMIFDKRMIQSETMLCRHAILVMLVRIVTRALRLDAVLHLTGRTIACPA